MSELGIFEKARLHSEGVKTDSYIYVMYLEGKLIGNHSSSKVYNDYFKVHPDSVKPLFDVGLVEPVMRSMTKEEDELFEKAKRNRGTVCKLEPVITQCKLCKGTGMIYDNGLYDPPSQCDCLVEEECTWTWNKVSNYYGTDCGSAVFSKRTGQCYNCGRKIKIAEGR